MKVLIFEDDIYLEEEMTSILKKEGFEVNSFNASEEAIEWLEKPENMPDLALLDIVENATPTSDEKFGGFDVAQKLKELDTTLPIVFFSAFGDDSKIKSMAEKFSPFELYEKGKKPNDGIGDTQRQRIVKKIKRVLNKKRLEQTWEQYFSLATFGKVTLKGNAFPAILDGAIPEKEVKTGMFPVKVEDIIMVESITKEEDGKNRQYLMLLLNNDWRRIEVLNVTPTNFYRQIQLICQNSNIKNPFLKVNGGTFINVHFIAEIDKKSGRIRHQSVKGTLNGQLVYKTQPCMINTPGQELLMNALPTLRTDH